MKKIFMTKINNINIYQVAQTGYKFILVTPNGFVIESQRYLKDAELRAKQITDYLEDK